MGWQDDDEEEDDEDFSAGGDSEDDSEEDESSDDYRSVSLLSPARTRPRSLRPSVPAHACKSLTCVLWPAAGAARHQKRTAMITRKRSCPQKEWIRMRRRPGQRRKTRGQNISKSTYRISRTRESCEICTRVQMRLLLVVVFEGGYPSNKINRKRGGEELNRPPPKKSKGGKVMLTL
jgi:hypothetical protein